MSVPRGSARRPAAGLLLLLSALAAGIPAPPARAHVVTTGAGTAALVAILEEKVFITFDLSFSEAWARDEILKVDADHDGAITEEEADAYMASTWEAKLAPALELRLDTVRLPLVRASMREVNLVGEVRPGPVTITTSSRRPSPPSWPPGGRTTSSR